MEEKKNNKKIIKSIWSQYLGQAKVACSELTRDEWMR